MWDGMGKGEKNVARNKEPGRRTSHPRAIRLVGVRVLNKNGYIDRRITTNQRRRMFNP